MALGTYSATGKLDTFLNNGNRAIFNSVFGKLTERYNGRPLNPVAARNWDMVTLAEEQNLTQQLYSDAKAKGYFNRVEDIATGTGRYFYGNWFFDTFQGDIYSVQSRWSYGMSRMGYTNSESRIPQVGHQYYSGKALLEALND